MNLKNIMLKMNAQKDENTFDPSKLRKIVNFQSDKKVLIEVKDLKMEYKRNKKVIKKVYDKVSFKIYEGEVVALLGGNGAGKTTTVEIIAGIKQQSGGQVIYHNEDKGEMVGVQFQDLSFPKGLTVKDFIDFQLMMSQSKNDISEDYLAEMIKTFKLKDLLKMKVSKLSGGQQQRLNVLIAMMSKPKVLFLDEFTTGLDIAIKNEIKEFILKYAKLNNITIVLISHDIDIIDQIANRFILIANQEIMIDTDRKTIEKEFKTVSNFLFQYIR